MLLSWSRRVDRGQLPERRRRGCEDRPKVLGAAPADNAPEALSPLALRAELVPPGPEPPGAFVQRVPLGEADSAVNLVGDRRRLSRRLACPDLGRGHLKSRVAELGRRYGGIRGGARRGDFAGERRELLLYRLEAAYRAPELVAFAGAAYREFKDAIKGAGHEDRARQGSP